MSVSTKVELNTVTNPDWETSRASDALAADTFTAAWKLDVVVNLAVEASKDSKKVVDDMDMLVDVSLVEVEPLEVSLLEDDHVAEDVLVAVAVVDV